MKNMIRNVCRCTLGLLGAVLFLSAPSAQAADLAPPTGKVLLTVQGAITKTNTNKVALFDRQQLEQLGLHKLVTSNPFIEGIHTFEGPLLSSVLDQVGAKGETLEAHALDGYNVDIPVSDVRTYPVILAMKMDGKVMRVRSKGPLWIIYPVDQFGELKSEAFSGRSIWQLTTLTVK